MVISMPVLLTLLDVIQDSWHEEAKKRRRMLLIVMPGVWLMMMALLSGHLLGISRRKQR